MVLNILTQYPLPFELTLPGHCVLQNVRRRVLRRHASLPLGRAEENVSNGVMRDIIAQKGGVGTCPLHVFFFLGMVPFVAQVL